jgi:hypothetical protein
MPDHRGVPDGVRPKPRPLRPDPEPERPRLGVLLAVVLPVRPVALPACQQFLLLEQLLLRE